MPKIHQRRCLCELTNLQNFLAKRTTQGPARRPKIVKQGGGGV